MTGIFQDTENMENTEKKFIVLPWCAWRPSCLGGGIGFP